MISFVSEISHTLSAYQLDEDEPGMYKYPSNVFNDACMYVTY